MGCCWPFWVGLWWVHTGMAAEIGSRAQCYGHIAQHSIQSRLGQVSFLHYWWANGPLTPVKLINIYSLHKLQKLWTPLIANFQVLLWYNYCCAFADFRNWWCPLIDLFWPFTALIQKLLFQHWGAETDISTYCFGIRKIWYHLDAEKYFQNTTLDLTVYWECDSLWRLAESLLGAL
jgi:hypothetical protein